MRAFLPASVLLVILAMIAVVAFPGVGRAQEAERAGGPLAGVAIPLCIAPARAADVAAKMFGASGRFACDGPQTRFGAGDFWALSPPLATIPGIAGRTRVRVSSVWQDTLTLYALYPGGAMRAWRLDQTGISRHLQLGTMIEWRLPPGAGTPARLMWRIENAGNLRGIVLAPRLATAQESVDANIEMAAVYAGFVGLCFALLIYNLAMWGALHHRFQLVYCAMVFWLMLYAISSSGALAWAFPGIANNDRLRINYVLLSGVVMAALMFSRTFFVARVSAGWVGRVANHALAALALATVALVALAPWQLRVTDSLYSLAFGGVLLASVPILYRAWRQQTRHLWLFGVAWTAPFLFALLRLMSNLDLIPWSFWLDNSTILAMAFEAVVSTLAISYRIRLLSQERDAAIERELVAARLADTDPLTGLLNRRAFLRHAIGSAGDQTLLIVDIDHFKRINETIGHDGGDEVLRLFARTLRQTAPGALIARMGGEEFAILSPAIDAVPADSVLARLRAARMPFDLSVTASIGVCTGPVTAETEWKTMYRQADIALFEAKQAGRDRARFALKAA